MRLIAILACFCWCSIAYAETIPDFNALCSVIKRVENSEKYPYGIKSINTHGDATYARRLCLNTVRNQYKRWKNRPQGDNRSYLVSLRDRYAPLSDSPSNANWLNNVKYYYKGGE